MVCRYVLYVLYWCGEGGRDHFVPNLFEAGTMGNRCSSPSPVVTVHEQSITAESAELEPISAQNQPGKMFLH